MVLGSIAEQEIGVAVISITTGQRISAANRALIVPVNMNQLHHVATEQALLHG